MADVTKIQEIFYELRVEEVMTRDVITIEPQTSLHQFQEILRTRRISGVPVVEHEQLVGVISLADLIEALEAGQMDQQVSDWMTVDPQVLYANEVLVTAIHKLERTNYGRFPVLNRVTNELVGILTRGDVIQGTLKQLDINYRKRESQQYRARYFFDDVVSDDTSILLRYKVQARDVVNGGHASSQIKRSLQRLGIAPKLLRRVAVAAYEAEMNLVLHTDHGGYMEAQIRPGSLCLDVVDDGPGILDVERALQPGFSTAPEWIRELGFGAGMGLTNIQNCADEMTLESEIGQGTHLWVVFSLDPVQG